ncbi:UNVERIFIED_CONTAM: 2-oxo acid dehydrogenase subunit E2 [Microbacterium sp. SLM126]
MSTVVRMPALAAGAAEAAIQSWLVAIGDEVSAGQAIVEIETEKAVVEYEAEAAGTLAGILVPQGEAAAVGAPIAVLAGPGQSVADALAEAGAAVGADTVAAPSASEPSAPDSDPAPAAPSAGAPASPDTSSSRRLFASPLVRRLAKERGLDLDAITGSGPNGRIVRRDIEDLGATSAPAPAAATSAPAADAMTSAVAAYTDVPHTRMRRAIARRLTESTTTVPHFFLVAQCRVDELLAVRARVNEGGAARISVNDFVLKAVASAMQDVPEANAIWTDDATRRFSGVDIAVAVSVPGGLVTPVVRGVDRLRLSELSRRVRELAERARDGKIGQAELEGGSFSVSNLGMYGTTEFSAIINPPHSGILAVGAATRRPVVGDDGELAVATVMTVTLSADHRVLDGALAAQWLDAFVRRIQNPLSMLV